jgi:hypothetical protein
MYLRSCILLLALVLFLTGCATAQMWFHTSKGLKEFTNDHRVCDEASIISQKVDKAAETGNWDSKAYSKCMHAKGYQEMRFCSRIVTVEGPTVKAIFCYPE